MPDKKPASKKPRGPIPGAPKPGRPGHNGGGWLLSGNTKGVGRKPAEVRGEILDTVGEATSVMRSILDGEFKVPVHDMFGKVVAYRPANIKEVATVYKALVGHALPIRNELSGPGGLPIKIENTVPDVDAYLDRLDPSEIAVLEAIAAKVHADPDAG